jgi:hypothetical protein
MFKKYFSSDQGRPTKDLQSILGLFILQALLDLADAEAVEAYCFNDAYRYSLDIPRDSYLSMRAYYYYRQMLLGQGHDVFQRVLQQIANRLNFEHSIQRKDSTLVQTNLKRMSRLELFTTTTRAFLKELKKHHPIIFSRISNEFRERYLPSTESESWFAGDKPSQYAARLIEAAKDVLWLTERFGEHGAVSSLEGFGLLQRLAREQIEVAGDTVEVKLHEECRGSAMVNPHDPEARYDGHRKQVGYQVQLTETCAENKDIDNPKIITQIEVELANTPDGRGVVEGVEKLEADGLKPDFLLTDNGYASDEKHQQLQTNGVEHVCPPAGEAPDGFGVIDFTLDEAGKAIEQCPWDQPCTMNKVNEKPKKTASYFDIATCRACPDSHACPVKITKRKARLEWEWKRPRLEARRLCFDEDKETKDLFRQRSGGESPMFVLKNKMGLKRSRRRGREKVTLAVFMAATALNVLRMHQWLYRKAVEAAILAIMRLHCVLMYALCYYLFNDGYGSKRRSSATTLERRCVVFST